MAQIHEPGLAEPRIRGAHPSGLFSRDQIAGGGWGFVLPHLDGTFEVARARSGSIIGSGSGADIRIEGPGVAPEHARVDVRADGVYLEDLGTPGGTYVGGVRAQRIGAAHGDVVRFGEVLAVFVESGLSAYKGRLDPALPFVAGPHDESAFVEPAAAYARQGQSFAIQGGPGIGKRTLADMVAHIRAPSGSVVTVDATDFHPEALEQLRARDPATWIVVLAERLPRPAQIDLAQAVSRKNGAMIIATLETPLDRAIADGLVAPALAAVLEGRRVKIPPLSTRREDIPGIIWALARKIGIDPRRITVELIEQLARAGWPGGISEIEQVLRDAAGSTDGPLDAGSVHRPLSRSPRLSPSPPAQDDPSLARERLTDALAKAKGSIASAARVLRMSRQAIYREAQRLGLDVGKRRAGVKDA